jgi:adenine deaminase
MRDGIIIGVGEYTGRVEIDAKGGYLCPGLIDGHVHIESSMAILPALPMSFLKKEQPLSSPIRTRSQTSAVRTEFNTCSTKRNGFTFVFMMVPSCVPATAFETSGAKLTARDMEPFISHPRVLGLGEVMDFVAVVEGEGEMLDKLHLFAINPIDGHAHAHGGRVNAYCVAGPYTDHECITYDEVLEKLARGCEFTCDLARQPQC